MTLLSLLPLLPMLLGSPAPKEVPPVFCVEWIQQSRDGYERFTLFADRTLAWKAFRDGAERVRRKKLEPDELAFYCDFFARAEFWELPDDLRTGLTGDFATQSSVTLARPDGSRKRLRFDALSALPDAAGKLRSALEGLRLLFSNTLAPASRFTPETLPPGTLLKRFDGAVFRVRQLLPEKRVVELEGVREPYSEFKKIDELRFQFAPPQ